MRVFPSLIATIGFLALNSEQVNAWGAAGHEMTATIAQIYLHPSVLPQICSLIYPWGEPKDGCHLAPIATWADRIRFLKQYNWAAPFHYVGGTSNWPPHNCLFGEEGWEGRDGVNVLGGIWNTTNWVQDSSQDPRARAEALKFLIHFLGDLHQPLHLTARERGGNEVKVHFHRRLTNLHSVWDGRLISNSILETPGNYSRPLPSPTVEDALRGAIYDPLIRSIIYEGTEGAWADELEEWISCPGENDFQAAMPFGNDGQLPLSPAKRHDPKRWDTPFICPYHWARPIQRLNCEVTFPPSLDWPPSESNETHKAVELNTKEYAGKIRKQRIVEKQLAMGGIRTAAVLNGLFAQEEFVGGKGLYKRTV